MPPRGRPPRESSPSSNQVGNQDYAERLTQIGALSGGAAHPPPNMYDAAEAGDLEVELEQAPPGSGPDFTVEGGEAEAEPAVVGGGDGGVVSPPPPHPSAPSNPHAPVLPPPEMPLASGVDADILAGRVIQALREAGAPVTDGVIMGSIQSMMHNAQAGILKDVTVDQVVGTAVRLNMKHQAAEMSTSSQESATRAQVMAEEKIPWRHERRFKVTINGWVMIVPANQLVMVPRSVHEVLQNAIAQEVVVKSMQLEMYNRMTGIPAPVEDPNLYEGFDDHNMRRIG